MTTATVDSPAITPHVATTIEPGAILYSSWGYDQTNVDFYVVVRTTKASAWIVPLSAESIKDTEGFMSDSVTAGDVFDATAKGELHRIQKWSDRESLSLSSYSSAYLWDGSPKYRSWYA